MNWDNLEEKIKSRIMKVKAMADGTQGPEKEAAENRLTAILQKHNIKADELPVASS